MGVIDRTADTADYTFSIHGPRSVTPLLKGSVTHS